MIDADTTKHCKPGACGLSVYTFDMTIADDIGTVEQGVNYVYVRSEDPDKLQTRRTLGWGQEPADLVSSGVESGQSSDPIPTSERSGVY